MQVCMLHTHTHTTGAHTHTHTTRPTQFLRLLLTVSRQSVWRTAVLSKGWPGRADLRLWRHNAGDRGSIRELKIRKGLDAGGEEERWSSWIFIVSHICSSLVSTFFFFFFGAVRCRNKQKEASLLPPLTPWHRAELSLYSKNSTQGLNSFNVCSRRHFFLL